MFENVLDERNDGSTMRKRNLQVVGRSVTALAMGLALSVGGATLASASSHHHDDGGGDGWGRGTCASGRVSPFDYASVGTGGYVTAVTLTSVTVQLWNGTSATYTLTPTTTYSEGTTGVTAVALIVGDRIRVETSPSAPTTATSINIELAELFGKVTAVSGDDITITDFQGFTRTIVVGPTTTYTIGGVGGSLSSVTIGSWIFAKGTVDPNKTSLDALTVAVSGASIGSTETIRGVVTAFTTSSVTVESDNSTSTTFSFTTATTFKDDGLTLSASLLAVGQKVGVEVNTSANTTALNVEIELAHLEGTVTAVSGSTITVSGPQDFSRVINVSSTTTYTLKGAPSSLAYVLVGDHVKALGTIAADQMSLNAISVKIGQPQVDTPTPTPQGNGRGNGDGDGSGGNHDGRGFGFGFGGGHHHHH